MFYILAPFDESTIKKEEPAEGEQVEKTQEEREKIAAEQFENSLTHFGKVEVDNKVLSQLYQDTRDLIDKMKAS